MSSTFLPRWPPAEERGGLCLGLKSHVHGCVCLPLTSTATHTHQSALTLWPPALVMCRSAFCSQFFLRVEDWDLWNLEAKSAPWTHCVPQTTFFHCFVVKSWWSCSRFRQWTEVSICALTGLRLRRPIRNKLRCTVCYYNSLSEPVLHFQQFEIEPVLVGGDCRPGTPQKSCSFGDLTRSSSHHSLALFKVTHVLPKWQHVRFQPNISAH